MAHRLLAVALSMVVTASPLSAASHEPVPAIPAPEDSPGARYCMHVEPDTGSLVERIRCWTRAEWAEQGVDVDREWSREGVAVINNRT